MDGLDWMGLEISRGVKYRAASAANNLPKQSGPAWHEIEKGLSAVYCKALRVQLTLYVWPQLAVASGTRLPLIF